MPGNDLREYLDILEKAGELLRITEEVDWYLEAGAVARRAQDLRAPAPFFQRVKGYPESIRLLGNSFGPTKPVVHGRVSLALGLHKDTPSEEIIREFARRLEKPIKPVRVKEGRCKENIVTGDAVDLTAFPAPHLHTMDGGRFFGSWHINIIKDPDSGWVNWGTYRHMLLDKNRLGFLAQRPQHGPSIYYDKYEARGKPMPMAVAMGCDPLLNMAAAAAIPANINEVDAAGGLRESAVELIRCETCDLEVPANAEIVLEGEVISERQPEGPFSEFTGYCSQESLGPVFQVKCITFRDQPIMTFSCHAKPWDDGGVMSSISSSALLSHALTNAGLSFKSLYSMPHVLAVIVSTAIPYPGFVQVLASAIWGTRTGIGRPYIIVVGEDVDPTDPADVLWCLTTRLHPATGVHTYRETPANSLWPFLSREEKERRQGSKLLLNATFPAHWEAKDVPLPVDFQTGWPPEVRERVLKRWNRYGYK